MSEDGQSHAFKKISSVLGVSDDSDQELAEIEQQLDESLSPEEIEAREKEILMQKRKEETDKLNEEIDKISSLDDDEFIKKSLREIAKKGFKILNVMQQEINDDPRDRAVEVASGTMTAITNAIEALDKYDKGNKHLEQSQQKITLRKQEIENRLGMGHGGEDGFIIANTNDLLKRIAQNAKEDIDQSREIRSEAKEV